jgi:hypothetical protein
MTLPQNPDSPGRFGLGGGLCDQKLIPNPEHKPGELSDEF